MKWKIIFVIVAWSILASTNTLMQQHVTPIMAVHQLEDSYSSSTALSGYKGLLNYYWVLYVLPLAVFLRNGKKKKSK